MADSQYNIILGAQGGDAVTSAIGKLVTGIAGLAAVAAAARSALNGLRDSINLGGGLSDLSDRTGQTISDLVILRRALDAAGVSAEALPQLLGTLQRSLAGINEDGGPTAETFTRLGLSMGRLRQMTAVQQLEEIGAALQRLPTQADRAAAAMQIFGRGGTQLLPLFRDGGAFSQARRDAGELANVMERNARAFDQVGDRVSALHTKLQAAYAIVAERLVPVVDRFAASLQRVDATTLANGLERAMNIGLAVGGALALTKLFAKAQAMAAAWSTETGSSVAKAITGALTPLRGALSGLLAVGLGFAIGAEIKKGLAQFEADRQVRSARVVGAGGDRGSAAQDAALAVRSTQEAQERAAANQSRLNELAEEERKIRSATKELVVVQSGPYSAVGAERTRALSEQEEARLKAIALERQGIADANALYADQARLKETIAANAKADAEAQAKQQATARGARELFELETQLVAAQSARNQPEIDRLQRLIDEAKLKKDLREIENQGVSTAGLLEQRISAQAAAQQTQRAEAQAAFDLATQQQIAQLEANRDEENRLALLAREKELRIQLQALGAAAEPMIQQRLTAERQVLDRQTAQAVLQAKLTAAQAAADRISEERSNINQSQLLDENTKLQRLADNTEAYRKALARVVELKLQERRLSVDAAEQAKLDAEIGALRANASSYGQADMPAGLYQQTRLAYQNRGSQTNSYQSLGEGVNGGAMEFANSIGTAANNAAQAVQTNLNAALGETSNFLYNLGSGAMSFDRAWRSALLNVGQAFLRTTTDMVAKEFWRATVDRSLKAEEVATHAAAEGAKTVATGSGAATRGGLRLGETIFHGLQVAMRVAAHVAGEAAQTAATIANTGIRILQITLESVANVIKAGVEALASLASIPYVGPFLGLAAMAAVVAAGMGMIGKRAHGGDVTAGSPFVVGDGGRPEVFVPTVDGTIVPSLEAFAQMSGAVSTRLGARGAALISAAATSMGMGASAGSPTAAGGGRAGTIAIVDNRRQADSIRRGSRGEVEQLELVQRNKYRIFGKRIS